MRVLKRLIVMALLGALGALLGAAAGEALFLEAPAARVEAPQREICLVFDLSESMLKQTAEGVSQLESLRQAALGFVSTPEFQEDTLSLVGFSDDARLICQGSRAEPVGAAIRGLQAGGWTNLGRGLEEAREVLAPAGDGAWLLLFTDGKPRTKGGADPVEAALREARNCRDAGIHIVAVGTGLADRALLEEITADPSSVFVSAPEALGEAFRRSGELIQNRQMLASQPTAIGLEESLKRACGWAALVASGAGLALVIGQNRHLRRHAILRVAQALLVLIGAAASGLAAGAAGQATFYALSASGALQPALRMVAWILLGGGTVAGMSLFVPNLPRGRALLGGALGGAAAAAGFLRLTPEIGDIPGRLLGAATLGFMAGAMTVLVEASVRRAWLVVHWPRGETSTLLLGATPIIVGRSASAHICPAWDAELEPVIGAFTCTDEGIHFEHKRTGKRRRLRGGDRLTFDPIVVEVRVEHVGEAESGESVAAERPVTAEAREQASPRAALPRTRRSEARTGP